MIAKVQILLTLVRVNIHTCAYINGTTFGISLSHHDHPPSSVPFFSALSFASANAPARAKHPIGRRAEADFQW